MTTRGLPRRRGGERGQMVPLLAIFAVVLLGCTAIATDLSVSTHYKRNLQNVTDAAALAGAKQLPVKADAAKQLTATQTALAVLHNTFPWVESGSSTPLALATNGCSGAALQCSVTVCAGLTVSSGCSSTVSGNGNEPFSLTVNTPPKTALDTTFNNADLSQDPNYYQRVEVVMHQQSGGFFSGIFGVGSEIAGAQSIAWHFASEQPFPFALWSRTVVQDGNSPEIIAGNVYAQRYLSPQADGQAAICAGPDSNNNSGYVVLGALQAPDSGYAKDGQNNNPKVVSNADPLVDGVTDCTTYANAHPGTVAMSGNPVNTAGCAGAFGGSISGSDIVFDSTDKACEANPALTVPNVAGIPNLPAYTSTYCPPNPSSTINPWVAGTGTPPNANVVAFQCTGNNKPSLLINSTVTTLVPGIYEILPSGNAPCDVVIDGTGPKLNGVTFYLMKGAGICASPASGVEIDQTAYCGTCSPGPAKDGDGVYDVLSDNSGLNPSITMDGTGGGSTSGVWKMTGVIWLPTGTVTIQNKNALWDTGQVIVNSWNDSSGYHPDPSITYNEPNSPGQHEQLKLVG